MDRNTGYLVPLIPPGGLRPKGIPLRPITYVHLFTSADYVVGDYVDAYYVAENYVAVNYVPHNYVV
jgi:hypothetical protein